MDDGFQDPWDHGMDVKIRFRFLEVSGSNNYRPRNSLRERWLQRQSSPAIAGDIQGNEITVRDNSIVSIIKIVL